MHDINQKTSRQQDERIKELELQLELERLRQKPVDEVQKRKTSKGTWVVTILIVIVILSVIGGLISNSSQSNNQPQTGASTSEVSKFTQLNSCLDNVDSWWNANATTNGMALDLLPNYQQQVNQCKTEYPVAASPAYQSQNEACINNVDQWWGKEATTVGLADMMLPVKTEMVTECSTRYPNS